MAPRAPRYSKEEFERRGTELYEQKIRPLVEKGNHGRVVVLDIETGEYQVADDGLEACQPLIARNSDAQLYCIRIGHRAVERFGFQPTAEKP
jgi:hypothetical protein